MKLEIILDRSFKIIFLSIPDDEIDFLWKSIENKGRDEKLNLAGHIDSSYQLFDKDNWLVCWLIISQILCINYLLLQVTRNLMLIKNLVE